MTTAGDRFLTAPFVLSLAWPTALVLTRTGYSALAAVGSFVVLFGWATTALLALPIAIDFMSRRSWRSVVSVLVLPISAAIAGFYFQPVMEAAGDAGDVVHVWLYSPAYLAAVSHRAADDHPVLMIFDLDAGDGVDDMAVYDESDEIARPPEQRSDAWKRRADKTLLRCDPFQVIPAGGHFYVARIGTNGC